MSERTRVLLRILKIAKVEDRRSNSQFFHTQYLKDVNTTHQLLQLTEMGKPKKISHCEQVCIPRTTFMVQRRHATSVTIHHAADTVTYLGRLLKKAFVNFEWENFCSARFSNSRQNAVRLSGWPQTMNLSAKKERISRPSAGQVVSTLFIHFRACPISTWEWIGIKACHMHISSHLTNTRSSSKFENNYAWPTLRVQRQRPSLRRFIMTLI